MPARGEAENQGGHGGGDHPGIGREGEGRGTHRMPATITGASIGSKEEPDS